MGVRLFDETNHTHVYINGERLKVDTRSEGQFQYLDWYTDGGPGDTFVTLFVDNPFDFPIYISLTDRSWYPEDDPDFTVMTAATSSSSIAVSAVDIDHNYYDWNLEIPPHQTRQIFYWDGDDEITSFWIGGISIFYFDPEAGVRAVNPKDYCNLTDIEV